MKIAGLVQDSIVDGPVLRFAVFTQGCEFKCPDCHNPATWDIEGGTEIPVEEIIAQMRDNPLTDGLTLTGGEPLMQTRDCIRLAEAAQDNEKTVWLFTGYDFDELLAMANKDLKVMELLRLTDVLVDGRYVNSQRSLSLRWRGSRNQRVLNLPGSLAAGKAVEFDI